jgi:transcriptional regulator with XRE-family HTH domain
MLANPKRKLTYKQLAEKYGVSEMAITRIKRGENWGHVKI